MEGKDFDDATNYAREAQIGQTCCNTIPENYLRLVDTISGAAKSSQIHVQYGRCTLDKGGETRGLEHLALQTEKNDRFATDDFVKSESISVEHVI